MSTAEARLRARFARTAIVTDMGAVAEAFRKGAAELDEYSEAAPAWDPATLRRKMNDVITRTVAAVVDAETVSERMPAAPAWVDPTDPRGRP
jgi:hypothetical protein